MREIKHGTRSTYSYHRCRCDLCRTANREAQAQYRERMRLQGYVFRRGLMRRPRQTGEGDNS